MADAFDKRIYRSIGLGNSVTNTSIIPGETMESNVYEWIQTPGDVLNALSDNLEANPDSDLKEEMISTSEKQVDDAIATQEKYSKNPDYMGIHSMMHPYALLTLAGSIETNNGERKSYIIDKAKRRRWYEVDAPDNETQYAKAPTTTAIMNWARQDERGRFPYSFQDFVYCKYWNIIPNNRMITLRRYAAPVTDNVEPANYNENGEALDTPFSPLATAVTYFGEDTDNTLSSILKFTVGYNWETQTGDVWGISSTQNEGNETFGSGVSWLNSGVGALSTMLGIMGDLQGKGGVPPVDYATGLPPDPYNSGPYENRILGPVNVIDTVMKRKRGLQFSNDGLTLTFEYVARPISNVNSKAIMIDIMSNILTMTSASGTFFGGLQRYRNSHPAMYPWRGKDSLNKLYSGKILGKDGAFRSIIDTALESFSGFYSNFLSGFMDSAMQTAKSVIDGVKNFIKPGSAGEGSDKEKIKENAKDTKQEAQTMASRGRDTLNRVVASKVMKGANVPWVDSMHALLTGNPVGDWHLTIGNPLNPIAVIGNLIVDHCDFEFSDELGPDDFPVSFKAIITLKHGMGRDRDGVQSMFNRGAGRTYTLSDFMKSTADKETAVDRYTGDNNPFADKATIGKSGTDRWIITEGADFIYDSNVGSKLSNSGTNNIFTRRKIDTDLSSVLSGTSMSYQDFVKYKAVPWTIRYTM